MKAIVISEKEFEREFEATLDKLRADLWDQGVKLDPDSRFGNSPIGQMHSRFHYEVCRLRERLKEKE